MNTIIVTGPNGSGKTEYLNKVWYTLGGFPLGNDCLTGRLVSKNNGEETWIVRNPNEHLTIEVCCLMASTHEVHNLYYETTSDEHYESTVNSLIKNNLPFNLINSKFFKQDTHNA